MEASASASVSTSVPVSASASASVVGGKKEEKKTGVQRYKSILLSSLRRGAVIDYYIKGSGYGHPELLEVTLAESEVTHAALKKLCEPDLSNDGKSVIPSPPIPGKIYYSGSDAYVIPRALKPADETKSSGGPSGVMLYHRTKISTKPGIYILQAAAEAMVKYIVCQIADEIDRDSNVKATVKHSLTLETLSAFMASAEDPFVHQAAGYFASWRNQLHGMPVTSSTGKSTKTVWLPDHIEWPKVSVGMGLTASTKYILDNIKDHGDAEKAAVGRRVYGENKAKLDAARLRRTEEAKSKKASAPSASAPSAASAEEGKRGRKKKAEAPPKSPLDLAVQAERKELSEKEKDEDEEEAKVKVSAKNFDITPFLSGKGFAMDILEERYGAMSPISRVSGEVKRFLDDLFNHYMVTIAEIAVQMMAMTKTGTLSSAIASSAIKAFLTGMSLGTQCEVKRLALEEAERVTQAIKSNREDAKLKRETTLAKKVSPSPSPASAPAPAPAPASASASEMKAE